MLALMFGLLCILVVGIGIGVGGAAFYHWLKRRG